MRRSELIALVIALAVCSISVTVWMLWSKAAKTEEPQKTDELVASSSVASNRKDEAEPMSAPQKETQSENWPQANSQPDLKEQKLPSELERLANSAQYRHMLERQERGELLTVEDMDLLLELADMKGRMIEEPEIKKSTTYPPDDPKTQAMWEWWRKMKVADPMFEYKRPIAFYGKVVDDSGIPVQEATVGVAIAGSDGDKRIRLVTDQNGLFSIVNEKGKRIRVGVGKRGYSSTEESTGYFEFAEFFSETFHEPDPSDPVVFVLQRLAP